MRFIEIPALITEDIEDPSIVDITEPITVSISGTTMTIDGGSKVSGEASVTLTGDVTVNAFTLQNVKQPSIHKISVKTNRKGNFTYVPNDTVTASSVSTTTKTGSDFEILLITTTGGETYVDFDMADYVSPALYTSNALTGFDISELTSTYGATAKLYKPDGTLLTTVTSATTGDGVNFGYTESTPQDVTYTLEVEDDLGRTSRYDLPRKWISYAMETNSTPGFEKLALAGNEYTSTTIVPNLTSTSKVRVHKTGNHGYLGINFKIQGRNTTNGAWVDIDDTGENENDDESKEFLAFGDYLYHRVWVKPTAKATTTVSSSNVVTLTLSNLTEENVTTSFTGADPYDINESTNTYVFEETTKIGTVPYTVTLGTETYTNAVTVTTEEVSTVPNTDMTAAGPNKLHDIQLSQTGGYMSEASGNGKYIAYNKTNDSVVYVLKGDPVSGYADYNTITYSQDSDSPLVGSMTYDGKYIIIARRGTNSNHYEIWKHDESAETYTKLSQTVQTIGTSANPHKPAFVPAESNYNFAISGGNSNNGQDFSVQLYKHNAGTDTWTAQTIISNPRPGTVQGTVDNRSMYAKSFTKDGKYLMFGNTSTYGGYDVFNVDFDENTVTHAGNWVNNGDIGHSGAITSDGKYILLFDDDSNSRKIFKNNDAGDWSSSTDVTSDFTFEDTDNDQGYGICFFGEHSEYFVSTGASGGAVRVYRWYPKKEVTLTFSNPTLTLTGQNVTISSAKLYRDDVLFHTYGTESNVVLRSDQTGTYQAIVNDVYYSNRVTPDFTTTRSVSAPQLVFDGYNRLNLSNSTPTSTTLGLPDGTTRDLTTQSNVYIYETGTYTANVQTSDTFAYLSNVVGTVFSVIQPTLVNTIPITAGDFSGYNYQHEATDTTNTYYEYNMSLNATGSTYFIGYNWTTKKWFDTNPTDANNTFGISATDTAATSRETTENPKVVYVIGTNNGQIVLESQFINPYFTGPSLTFDGFNKLAIENITQTSSSLRFGSNTYDTNTASNVYVTDTGEYKLEARDANTFVISNVYVDAVDTTTFTLAFHHGAFSTSDYSGVYSTVGEAATAGHVYSDTTAATYTWGTLNSVDTSTSGQTGYSWTPTSTITADVLMVAGGGGGGGANGGGGGAGGLVYNSGISLSGAKTIVVGAGGTKGINWNTSGTNATRGNNTSFTDLETAIGGGAGSTYINNPDIGSNDDGGSGGGGGGSSETSSYIDGGSGTSGQGNGGGRGIRYAGGGGGGAGGSGSDGSSPQTGGAGGAGLNYTTTFGTTYGDSGWFAGGGGGGQGGGQGGQGGGGDGGMLNTDPGYNGQSHTGGGGGGGNDTGGGDGGSGIVLIKKLGPINPPALTFDGYNKLTIDNDGNGDTGMKNVTISGGPWDAHTFKPDDNAQKGKFQWDLWANNTNYQIGNKHNLEYVPGYGWYVLNQDGTGFGDVTPTSATSGTYLDGNGVSQTFSTNLASSSGGVLSIAHTAGTMTVNESDFFEGGIFPPKVGSLESVTIKKDGAAFATTTSNTVYIRDTGTYTAEVKGSGAYAIELSKEVTGSISSLNMTIMAYIHSAYATDTSGNFWVWGKNSGGQLGLGHGTDEQPGQINTNTNIGTLVFRKPGIIAGYNSSYIVVCNTIGECWGWGGTSSAGGPAFGNNEGIGIPYKHVMPNDASTGVPVLITQCCGGGHALALGADSNVYSWGANTYNQLGRSGTTTSPARVTGLDTIEVVEVAVGTWASYALSSNGDLYSWGGNDSGQLGDNTSTSGTKSTPSVVATNVKMFSVHASHVIYAKNDNTVFTFGWNHSYQIGNGNTDNVTGSTHYQLTTFDNVPIRQVIAHYGSTLVLTESGEYWAWGENNTNQQLGFSGNTSTVTTPTKSDAASAFDIHSITKNMHASFILTNDGDIYTHGSNGFNATDQDTTTGQTTTWTKTNNVKNLLTAPDIKYDGKNKLTVSGTNYADTSNVTYYSNTYNLGTAKTMYVKDTGEYVFKISGTDKYVESNVYVSSVDLAGATTKPIDFDGYNKLTLIDAGSNVSANVTYFSNTYELGSANVLYINGAGTYDLEMSGSNVFALSSNVVNAVDSNPMGTYNSIFNIDGLNSSGKLGASHTGYPISFNAAGTRVVIGEYNSDKAHIYDKVEGSWTLSQTWTKSDGFGKSCAMSDDGNVVVVVENSGTNKLSLFVYENGSWVTKQNQISISGSRDTFGAGLFMSGDGLYLLATDYSYQGSGGRGRNKIYDLSEYSFLERLNFGFSTIASSWHGDIDRYGNRAIWGDGAADYWRVYKRSGATWSQSTTIAPSNTSGKGPASCDENMVRVALSDTGNSSAGVTIWYRNPTGDTFALEKTISVDNAGCNISMNYAGDRLIVTDIVAKDTEIWTRSGTTWTKQKTLNPDIGTLVNFAHTANKSDGYTLAIVNETYDSDRGRVYIYSDPITPSLTFDNYNKLTLENFTTSESDTRTATLTDPNGDTYSLGQTQNDIYIEDTGEYILEVTNSDQSAVVKKNVGAISEPTGYSSATPTLVDPIYITSGVWSHVYFEWKETGSTYYIYKLSGDPTDSDRYLKYDWVNLVWSDEDESGTYSTFGTSATDTSATARSSITNPTHLYLMAGNRLHATMVNPYYQVPSYPPSLTFDGYNKLSIENLTPTSTRLTYGSNTYEIGTASNVYIEDAGTYKVATGDATTFALVSNVVGAISDWETSNIFGFPLTSSIPSASNYSDVSTIVQGIDCEINNGSLKATNSSQSANDRTLYFHTVADYEEFTVIFDFNLSEVGSEDGVFFSAEDTASNMRVELQKYGANTIRAEIQSTLQPNFTQTSGFSDWAKLTFMAFNKTSSRPGRVKIYIDDVLKLDQEATTWTTSNLKFKYFTLLGGRPDGRWALPNARMKNFKFYNHTTLYDTGPSLTYDTSNKLSIENLTPTSTTLTDPNGSSFDIGTASNVYIRDSGTYSIASKDANTFVLASNTVTGTPTGTTYVYDSNTFTTPSQTYDNTKTITVSNVPSTLTDVVGKIYKGSTAYTIHATTSSSNVIIENAGTYVSVFTTATQAFLTNAIDATEPTTTSDDTTIEDEGFIPGSTAVTTVTTTDAPSVTLDATDTTVTDPTLDLDFTTTLPRTLKRYNNITSSSIGARFNRHETRKKRVEKSISIPTSFSAELTANNASSPTTLTVTVANSKFVINGDETPTLGFIRGETYTFDQSDASNSGHPLVLATSEDGATQYTTGWTTTPSSPDYVPGVSGAQGTFIVPYDVPDTIYYKCNVHPNMGGEINTTFGNVFSLGDFTVAANTHVSGEYTLATNYDGTTSNLYVNGELITQTTPSPAISAGVKEFILGKEFDGYVKNFKFWNYAKRFRPPGIYPQTLPSIDSSGIWHNSTEYRWRSSEPGYEIYGRWRIDFSPEAFDAENENIRVNTTTNIWEDSGTANPTGVTDGSTVTLTIDNGASVLYKFTKPTDASWID
jgi:alpha-tubulin suppressor-like RCC1 family protein